MPQNYRKPSEKESAKLEKAREIMQRGIQGEGDFLSKISTTMAKAARDDIKTAEKMRESVPQAAREGEAYQYAGYKKGGKVGSASKRADGCAIKGKTRGKII